MGPAYLERILLVCGQQNAGKSRLLRQMLSDKRLGGEAPASPRVRARALSRERALAIRFSSPHEMGEDPTEFHRKIERAREVAGWSFRRINYACAVQPRPFGKMPGIVGVCADLKKHFAPERIRVVQLVPSQGADMDSALTNVEVDGLRRLDVEVVAIDARQRAGQRAEPGNVRILADFFDFS